MGQPIIRPSCGLTRLHHHQSVLELFPNLLMTQEKMSTLHYHHSLAGHTIQLWRAEIVEVEHQTMRTHRESKHVM